MSKTELGDLSMFRGLACLWMAVLLCPGNKLGITGTNHSVHGGLLSLSPHHRMHSLQTVLAEHKQFDELLFSFSVWIKQFLSDLQTTSEINLRDYQVALTRHKVKRIYSEKCLLTFADLCRSCLLDLRSEDMRECVDSLPSVSVCTEQPFPRAVSGQTKSNTIVWHALEILCGKAPKQGTRP